MSHMIKMGKLLKELIKVVARWLSYWNGENQKAAKEVCEEKWVITKFVL